MIDSRALSKILGCSLLALTFAAPLGCDKGDAKADKKADKKGDAKKADDKADAKKAAEPEPEPEAPKGPMFTGKDITGNEVSMPLTAFDMAAIELPGYTIQVPEGTSAETKSPSGFKLFNGRVNFSITVSEAAFDMAQAKQVYGAVDPDGTIAEETEDHIIYQRSGEGGFLFQAGVTVGDKQFKCGTVASVSAFTRENIDQSVAACKSIAAAGGAPAGDAPAPAGDAPAGDAPAPAGN